MTNTGLDLGQPRVGSGQVADKSLKLNDFFISFHDFSTLSCLDRKGKVSPCVGSQRAAAESATVK